MIGTRRERGLASVVAGVATTVVAALSAGIAGAGETEGVVAAAVGVAPVVVAAGWSERPNSPAVPNRSAGSGASARRIASSTASGTVARPRRTLGGASVSRFIATACADGPVNGASPASISYTTAASE